MAVKRGWGVVKTECNFSLLLLHGRPGCVINCSRQRGIYEQVQMEVTSDLSSGVRRAFKPQDCRASWQPASLFLISSCRILFPNFILFRGNKGLSSGKGSRVFPKLWHFSFSFPFSLSRLKMSVVCRSHQPVRHLQNTCRCCRSRTSDSQAVCDVLVAECEEPSEASGQDKAALARKSTFKRPLNPCTFRKSPAFNFTQFCN